MAPQDKAGSTTEVEPLLSLAAITLITENLKESKEFYTKVFGARFLGGDEEACAVKFNNVILNLLIPSAGYELVQPSQVGARDSGKRTQLSVWVADLDAEIEKLKARGVTFLTGPETKPWGKRTVTFDDPSGHNWEIAQDV